MFNSDIIPRQAWGAKAPISRARAIFPYAYLMFSYQINTAPCYSVDECSKTILNLQKRHMIVMKLPDIAFNFLIGGDGSVYEGRGWATSPPRFKTAPEISGKAYYIGVIGDLLDNRPSKNMWDASWKIVELAYKMNYIRRGVEFSCEELEELRVYSTAMR